MRKLVSVQDASVNFVEEQLQGFLESRFVRRVPEYFICYLSSQSGCNHGCRFCHLTTTKQTKFENVNVAEYHAQAVRVLRHFSQEPADVQRDTKYVHFNFMARGEALSNQHFLNNADRVLWGLGKTALQYGDLRSKFNVSTIMPQNLCTDNVELTDIFRIVHPTIYYSLYSANPEFREKWMPRAMRLDSALELLANYQQYSKKRIKIHHCFIRGVNDSVEELDRWLDALLSYDLDWDFNLVRYNPWSAVQGEESPEDVIAFNLEYIAQACLGRVKTIPRVGYDVKASCGMFVGKQ